MSLLRQVLLDNPAGYWPLDEASGTTAFDRSGNGRNGTYSGSVTPGGRSSVLGAAPDFTGGYVAIADNAAWSPHAGATGAMTIECWALADTLGASCMIVAKGNSGQFEYRLDSSTDGRLEGIVSNLSGTETTDLVNPGAGTIVAGVANQLAYTYDAASSTMVAYKNGVQVASMSTATLRSSDGSAELEFGRRQDLGGVVWDGWIAHVAIFPSVLSAARIKAHYQEGIRSGVVHG